MSDHESPEERNRLRRLGDQLGVLLDPEAALRRGHGLVSGVTSTTKNEITRIVGAEVRNFLDKMDIADLAQQIIAGLQVDVNMTVRFTRDENGRTKVKSAKLKTESTGDDSSSNESKQESAESQPSERQPTR